MTRYTQQEDNVILQCVQQNPSNLAAAFECAANRLIGRTSSGVSFRYYSKIKPVTNSIAVASNTGKVHLGKNSRRTQVVPDATRVRDAMLYASVSTLSKDRAIEFLLSKMSDEAKSNLLVRIANRVGGR